MGKDLIFDGGEMKIANGDLFVDDSDQQHIQHILVADSGQFRQWPLLGVGIKKYLNGSANQTDIKQTIRVQLRSDNFTVKTLEVKNDYSIKIDAQRNEKT